MDGWQRAMLVSEVNEAVNDEDELTYQITGLYEGNEVSYYFDDPNRRRGKVYPGTVGDIVDYRYDSVNYDTVIIGTRESSAYEMILIKK